MEPLKGKRVFITGGANGIGNVLVKAFCREGAKVAFCDNDTVSGECRCRELAEYDCTFIEADVTNKETLTKELNNLINEWGDIDIIINNVGITRFKSIIDTSIEEFDTILNTNLRPVFITSKIFATHRAATKSSGKYGRIINIASTRALMSESNSEGNAASKGGIVSLTHALSISLSPYNITVNCISPGWINTGKHGPLKENDHLQHPSGRVGKPRDIANMCLFLCNPENDFINGQNFVIDGGMTKKMIYEE